MAENFMRGLWITLMGMGIVMVSLYLLSLVVQILGRLVPPPQAKHDATPAPAVTGKAGTGIDAEPELAAVFAAVFAILDPETEYAIRVSAQ